MKDNIVVGWTDYVKEHKDEALYWHKLWLDNGRPPQGEIALNRRRTRARYHYAIKFVNKEKNRIRSDRMAKAIADNNDRNLWAEAKKIKQSSNSIPNVMDNISGSDNIKSLFYHKFKHLYNSVGFAEKDLESLRSRLKEAIRNDHKEYKFTVNKENSVSVIDVKVAISILNIIKKRKMVLI